MNWLTISIIAYLLIALGIIIDKFLLSSDRVSHPVVYAFYSGILSFFTIFVFFPFGFQMVSVAEALKMSLVGIFFLYGILVLFFAIKKSEASRVIPVAGAIIPLATLAIGITFLGQIFSIKELIGIFVLIFGGLLISLNLPLRLGEKKFFIGFYYSILAGIFLAISYSGMDYFYEKAADLYNAEDIFSTVFIWTRMGVTLGAFSLLLIPTWRRLITNSVLSFKKEKKKHLQTGNLFILNKILNGVGSVLVNYAIKLGGATLVNALVSMEYVFVFILALIFGGIYPKVFSEKTKVFDILQKAFAVFIIAIGIFLITI